MTIDITFGRDEKELAPGIYEVREGMEILRTDETDEVWVSWEVKGCTGVMTFHINPKPEEIRPHWYKPNSSP